MGLVLVAEGVGGRVESLKNESSLLGIETGGEDEGTVVVPKVVEVARLGAPLRRP